MERFAIKIDKKLKANLYKICRLCGIDNPDMVPILSDKQVDIAAAIDVEAEMEMSQKINLLIGLSVTKDDKMPQTMCCLCVDKINDFYEFREMCYSTNAQTRKLLGLKNVKKPAADIKPKVEVKEESIVPTSTSAPNATASKNGNRKRKAEEVALKEEIPAASAVLSKKKLRFSTPAESAVIKEEDIPVVTKKKLRFTSNSDEHTTSAAGSNKKFKNTVIEDTKLKKEPSPPVPTTQLPAVSNKKLRLAVPPQKESTTKKSKQKAGKNTEHKDLDVKEEIKEEIKEEPASVPAAPAAKVPAAPKLKFGCNICKERFPAKVNLEAHTRTTHIPKIERYVCTACSEVLSKSFDIKNHQLWHKLSKTPYVCGCCGESILNTYAFSRHLREHAFETPPALLVLDRECPQCHTSYATNFLYNIHICAVKTRRCAGCNRLQRNDSEYLKHSAQCAKVYLNYSKHIMPSVEALEDAVRIKNENDVEAAAEEMARISGVSLDMAPVVQLTRLSSPIIMAANQCVSLTGLDDAASTSSKKSGKKGVSKKDLKRVDELLKSTLDALVSIKHEPEVHVDQETPCAGEHSDNDDAKVDDDVGGGADDFHYNDDSDNDNEDANNDTNIAPIETCLEPIKIKQEIDETNEENANKIGGGGLKLKIKKEHGQLNSSIIEQQKSSEKRAEKRKKKKKHKDKEKDKQKLSKEIQEDHVSQDGEENMGTATTIRIKSEPQDGAETADVPVAANVQIRPQPEATIMTSIPMMQFQISCVSSGVEFNSGTSTVVDTAQTVTAVNHETEPEDVKPNREELDRMLKISHVSSGIAMETDEADGNAEQPMDHDGNEDEGNGGEDDEDEDDNEESNKGDHLEEEQDDEAEEKLEDGNEKDLDRTSEDTGIDNEGIIAKKIKKSLLKSKSKLTMKPCAKPAETPVTKSRNKACKSTAKPPTMPVLQISAVRSGVTLEPTVPSASDFTPIFIKPEPQNRGYSDEQPAIEEPPLPPPEVEEETGELTQNHSAEEQNYISTIDFNNITIKQEKDIEISDVQITQKSVKSYAVVNGIKRKRKQVRRAHSVKDKTLEDDENMEYDEEHETDEDVDEENDDEDDEEAEEEEEEDEEAEEEEDEEEEEEEEEREYRELEYPPQLTENNDEIESKENQTESNVNANKALVDNFESQQVLDNEAHKNVCLKENIHDANHDAPNEKPSFVIASVCSQATTFASESSNQTNNEAENSKVLDGNVDHRQVLMNHDNSTVLKNSEEGPAVTQGIGNTDLSALVGTSNNSDIVVGTPTTVVPNVSAAHADLNATITLAPTLSKPILQKVSLQLGKPFEVNASEQHAQTSNSRQETDILDLAIQSSQIKQNTEQQDHLSTSREIQITLHIGQELQQANQEESIEQNLQNITQESLHITGPDGPTVQLNSQFLEQNPQNALKYSAERVPINQVLRPDSQEHSVSVTQATPNSLESQPQTSQPLLQPVFKISSVTSAALNISESNKDGKEIFKDNQEETATIEGVVDQSKDLNLQAQPVVTETLNNEAGDENEMEVDENLDEEGGNEDDNDLDDDDNGDDELTLGMNLEERQNYQNQEVLSQSRPAALALHPYLEDISSSSNSLLSNSLSQTPPPASQSVASTATTAYERQRLLNTEETENILNESNDALVRRSSELATTSAVSTGQPLPPQPAHLAQQLPPHMPTFNFDNINEIAENNNNANIEREQLQDGQQQTTNIQ